MLRVGEKGDDYEKNNVALVFPWSRVFRFREHLDFWTDVECGHLVRRYLEDVNKLLYFAEYYFNY